MMKVFMVHNDVYRAGNPYIYTLMEEISRQHTNDVKWGYGDKEFWEDSIFNYDIVHFHWPDVFMEQKKQTMNDFAKRIDDLKNHGVKIVSTCHDLRPHYNQCAETGDALNIVYEKSDMIFHLGVYSQKLFQKQYLQARHVILPHHIFNTVYTNFPSRKEGAERLHLNAKKRYILCFGAFRADEERQMVMEVAKHYKNKGIEILAPDFMRVSRVRRLPFLPNRIEIRAALIKRYYHLHFTDGGFVPVDDETLPYYYAVADIAFIQRKKILNSGNAILPFLFDKVVVGPDVGNVGPLLKEIGYPTFDPNNFDSIPTAIDKAFQMKDVGKAKHEELMKRYSTETISAKLYKYYSELIQTCDED